MSFIKIMGKLFTLYINLQDKNLDLSILNSKKFILALCPASLNNLTDKDIKTINEFLKNDCILAQRGNLGICKYKHEDGTEPWHENVCLHNPSLSFDEQISFMKKGKQTLEKTFGRVDVYCPINHLYDINTIKAAQVLKYKYFMDLNLQNLEPYENNDLIILPEFKLGEKGAEKSQIIYTHYGNLKEKEVVDFIKNNEFALPDKIKSGNNSNGMLTINEIKKKIRKLEKDLRLLKEKYEVE
jgi:hypothetical protein